MPFRRLGARCLGGVVTSGILATAAIVSTAAPSAAVGSNLAHESPVRAAPDGAKPVRRVLVLSLPAVVWSDLSKRYLPNLDALLADSAVANLSTRAPSLRADLVSGYATVGAGDKATAGRTAEDGAAYNANEDVGGEPAAELFARRTGLDVDSGLVHLGLPGLAAANESSLWRGHLGALGDALDRAGFSRAVIANGDGTERGELAVPQRSAVTALMGADGTVPGGSVSGRLLERDPGAPFGVHLDQDAVVDAFRAAWTDRSVVLVEASDLVRADEYANRQNPAERAATTDDALAQDRPAHRCAARRGRSRDRRGRRGGPDTESCRRRPDRGRVASSRGSCRSDALGTTQRAGYVQLMDVAPTILDVLGVHRPTTMRGRPFTVASSTASAQALRATLVDGNEAAQFRGVILTPVAIVFTVLVAALLLAAVVGVVSARGGRRRGLRILPWLALATLGYVAAVYLARLVPFHRVGLAAFWGFLAMVSFVCSPPSCGGVRGVVPSTRSSAGWPHSSHSSSVTSSWGAICSSPAVSASRPRLRDGSSASGT